MPRKATLFASLVLLMGPLLGCAPPRTIVQTPATGAPVAGISVTGIGRASGPPNIARATLGVEVRAAAADQAVKEANGTMARVIAELKRLGIADKDVRTTNVSMAFEREPEQPPRPMAEAAPAPATKPGKPAAPSAAAPSGAATLPAPAQPAGFYRASNTVEVTIRDLNRAGEVLGAAAASGANQMYGIAFEIEDPSRLEAQAREKALANARQRATDLAKLAGVRLGNPISIVEVGGTMPVPGPVMMRAEAAQVPVERGELTVTSNVQVVFELAKAD